MHEQQFARPKAQQFAPLPVQPCWLVTIFRLGYATLIRYHALRDIWLANYRLHSYNNAV